MPIYDRAMIREKTIWPSFLYGMPGVEATKAIVFGLYANTYLLGHNYLKDIKAEELQRLVGVYDSNMAELDKEEQNLVLEIASQRYLKAIETQIKNNTLATKEKQLNADEQEYDAKLAALVVDQEALNTKRTQIELERDRAELKNKDLEARIQLEELAQDYVAVEISQKELEVGKAELRVLTTALRGLEIQIDIANTSLQITELEATKTQYLADIKEIDVQVATVETSKLTYDAEILDINTRITELENSKKQYSADIVEINVQVAMLELSKKEITSEQAEIELKTEEAELRKIEYDADIANINMQIEQLAVTKAQCQADIDTMEVKIQKLEASKPQYEADIAMIKVRTAESKFSSSSESGSISERKLFLGEGDKKQLEYRVIESELHEKKEELIIKHETALEDEKDYIADVLIAKEDELKTEQVKLRTTQQGANIQTFIDRETESSEFGIQSDFSNTHKEEIATDKRSHRQELWEKDQNLYQTKINKINAISEASVAAAETLAAADIVTSLTHEIGQA